MGKLCNHRSQLPVLSLLNDGMAVRMRYCCYYAAAAIPFYCPHEVLLFSAVAIKIGVSGDMKALPTFRKNELSLSSEYPEILVV
jgi:hypothetical protein